MALESRPQQGLHSVSGPNFHERKQEGFWGLMQTVPSWEAQSRGLGMNWKSLMTEMLILVLS